MAKLASLKSETRLLDRRAADLIRSHILEGVLAAGARLLETQLSEELGVSRGTVRSALAVLAREGLVQQVAFTRWQVAETSVADAWEVYTLRGALEGLAARLAAGNITKSDGQTLRVTAAELSKAIAEKRYQDVTDIDFRLHQEIVALARHKRLADQHQFILQQVRFHMVNAGFLPKDYSALAEEHEALIDAVLCKDAVRAEQLARSHNEAEVELLSRFLQSSAKTPADQPLKKEAS
jgi:DNA-binding GntR family transcriptional regulator